MPAKSWVCILSFHKAIRIIIKYWKFDYWKIENGNTAVINTKNCSENININNLDKQWILLCTKKQLLIYRSFNRHLWTYFLKIACLLILPWNFWAVSLRPRIMKFPNWDALRRTFQTNNTPYRTCQHFANNMHKMRLFFQKLTSFKS